MLKDGELVQSAVRIDGLYIIKKEADQAFVSIDTWHKRLCHYSSKTIKEMIKKSKAKGLKIDDATLNAAEPPCRICALTKKTNDPFPKQSHTRDNIPGRTLHVDLCGPMETTSTSGSRYVMPVTDDFSRYTIAYFLNKKSDALENLSRAINFFERQSGNKVTNIRADNGGEFTSIAAKEIFSKAGITLMTSVPYCPQQNGVAERKNRTLMEATRAMLRTASLPKNFWQYAMSAAVHAINRLSSSSNDGRSPYELWNGRVPDIGYMRVFGCRAYAYIPKQKRRKMDDRAVSCIFLGYPISQKGYLLMDMDTKRKFVSRAITFDESRFPFESESEQTKEETMRENDDNALKPETEDEESKDTNYNSDDETEEDYIQHDREEAPQEQKAPGNRSRRQRQPPTRFADEQEDLMNNLSHRAFVALNHEPTTAKEALSDKAWKQAIVSEYNSLTKNVTWDLVSLPPERQAITGKWCFKLKTDATGAVIRKKARYVARGFSQKDGIDYDETFAPVISFTSLRVLLSLAAEFNMELAQVDIDTAYLYGDIDKELYLAQPEGFEKIGKHGEQLVCRLRKSIYGLKQSGRCWWKNLDSYLKDIGFQAMKAEPCLYMKTHQGRMTYIGVYVDDLIIASKTADDLKSFIKLLEKKYNMKSPQPLSYILGVRIDRDWKERKLFLSQEAYANTVLQRFRMKECNPSKTPAEPTVPKDNSEADSTRFPYREAIGSLMYLATCTRPDIAFAVSHLARSVVAPSVQDVNGVKRVLRYLRGTTTIGITLGGTGSILKAYADADFANDLKSRRSVSGNLMLIGKGPVQWSSRRQPCVALSTVEAEYVSLCTAAQTIAWLRNILEEFGVKQKSPTTIHEDSQGAISLAKCGFIGRRSKHIDVRMHYVQDQVETNAVNLVHTKSEDMLADILTKPLGTTTFVRIRTEICEAPCRVREGVLANDDRASAQPP